MEIRPDWPHQIQGVQDVLKAIARGELRILLTSPTGGGKTRMMIMLASHFLRQGKKVVIYSNRRQLVTQTSREMNIAGLAHGVRAAGHEDNRERDFQISSIQTEYARVSKGGSWGLHEADLALVDEAHIQKGPSAAAIMRAHQEAGCVCVGLTATPLDLGGMYDVMVKAGTVSELRACGALVRATHYGCDEPDLRKIGRVPLGAELTTKQNVKAIMTHGIVGRVLDQYRRINPENRPTILFGPGVAESLWFAQEFNAAGIPAAHIDGADVWIEGQFYRNDQKARGAALEGSRNGSICVLCNRFVLREGVNAPWLSHGIFACVFGSLQTYLQSGGRLLRSHPGVAEVTIQDHGGNWWRHGSINDDRDWELGYTSALVAGLREEALRSKRCPRCKAPLFGPVCSRCGHRGGEPLRCPKCNRILMSFRCVPVCGWEAKGGVKSRPVIQSDGTIREMQGDVFQPRRVSTKPDAAEVWRRMYYRASQSGMTFRQAEALFAQENHWGWPSRELPMMPNGADPADWFRKVKDVPKERLR